ncbi:hypothetical protein NP493_964g00095 [Ridgeia piscesae]|uniref:Uncharacterized protein n=1 Tax=Ridgeia piscesae TaxID=27915 RepID=A0AAD9NJB1_RIDPI|nr:hypothetical protein NP493_964g00095 [Ridgeia piscesae]
MTVVELTTDHLSAVSGAPSDSVGTQAVE